MTTLALKSLSIPTAEVGPVNPLPPIAGDASLDKRADFSGASATIRRQAAYGRVRSIVPYLMQDGYSRMRQPRDHQVAVLENEHLRATFLLGQGGRMWSLTALPAERELLYVNPIFQPANLGLRGAWFAGGVEWNIGTIGHTPLTCSPLHAARVTADDGTPVLRMYEFERLRRVVFQLDMHLPQGSRTLYVHVRIANPNQQETPLYWWSNIAVPQSADTRVLAPASHAWNYSYDDILRREPLTSREKTSADDVPGDISYPARFGDAADHFFDLDAPRRTGDGPVQPWIAAVQGDGVGLFQTSTAELTGRKLFRWGTGSGGHRWQQWLSGPAYGPEGGYAEIQAGLAATQFEHVPMPAEAVVSWTEVYGPLELDPAAVTAPWNAAQSRAGRAVMDVVPTAELARRHAAAARLATREPDEVLHRGSGWGVLERKLRTFAGEPDLDSPGTPFDDDSCDADQQPWLELLTTGDFPEPDGFYPGSVHCHPLLTAALAGSHGWAAAALQGVALAADGQWGAARQAFGESIRRRDNPYARRNLAVTERVAGNSTAMMAEYLRALELAAADTTGDPAQHRALIVESVAAMAATCDEPSAQVVLGVIDTAPPILRNLGRIRVWEAKAAVVAGDLDRAATIIADPTLEVADLREGEELLEDVFVDFHTARVARERGVSPTEALRNEVAGLVSLPPHWDFRMKLRDL